MLIKGARAALLVLGGNKFGNLSSLRKFSNMCTKKALIFLAAGAEEMEFVIAADVLRRGGVEVCVAGLCDGSPVKCSRDVQIKPDVALADVVTGTYDVLVLPGGLGGTKAMAECAGVGKMLKKQECEDRWIAAICAATTVLKVHDIAKGKKVTSYPAMKDELKGDYDYQESNVVVDGKLITSRGPGTAFDFALTIVEKLMGKEKACEVAKAMLVKY